MTDRDGRTLHPGDLVLLDADQEGKELSATVLAPKEKGRYLIQFDPKYRYKTELFRALAASKPYCDPQTPLEVSGERLTYWGER